MARHRGKFDPKSEEPYELSRSRIENFVRCPACFYMQQVEKIEFPSIPGFLLNEATDVLLKKYFDYFRAKQITPPFLKKRKLGHLVPFQHEEFELWTQSLHFGAPGRMHTVVDEYNLKIGGGVDDIWQDKNNGVLHVVDYKSTSKKTDGLALLDGFFAQAYKRQMDIYVWIMTRMGFDVSRTGYFLYVNGDRESQTDFIQKDIGLMEFKLSLIPYETDLTWIDEILPQIKKNLHLRSRPPHSDRCEYGSFLNSALS